MRQISSSGNNNNRRIVNQTRFSLAPEIAPPAVGATRFVLRDPLRSPLLPSNYHHYNKTTTRCSTRWFSSSSPDSLCPKKIQLRLNEFQELFVEARMCIDDVKDSFGTVYYDDDADDAREAVEAALQHFEALLKEITDIDEKNKVLRSNGLKVEQLKGELELTLSGGHDH
jgi:uncharacterized protein (DUF2164 family)